MARITKIEIEQQLIASQRDNAALREQLSIARAEIERLSAAPTAHKAAWQPNPAMQAARELAMRTGRVVRVGE